MENEIQELTDLEIGGVNGGFGPVAAYTIAIALGALFVASYQAGYQVGKDLAHN